VIITRENIKEEASNLNDEILNLEKNMGSTLLHWHKLKVWTQKKQVTI
jgi:hypothetical protein